MAVFACLGAFGALGGTTYAAVSSSRTTKITFTTAKLLNGWRYGGSPFAYPGYAKDSLGVVHLRGAVKNGNEGTEAFALPQALAPSHELWLPDLTGGEPSAVIVASTGQTIPDVPSYTSFHNQPQTLDEISFVGRGDTKIRFTNAKLLNGWKYGGSSSALPGYATSPLGVVYLRGGLFDGSSGSPAFVLPKALRPSHPMWLPIFTSGFTEGSLSVSTNGEVTPSGANAASYASLDGISFVAGGATKIRFTNPRLYGHWKYGGYSSAQPGYAKDPLGVVHLRGSVRGGPCATWPFQLPSGLRPSHWLSFPIYTLNGIEGTLDIGTDGEVEPCGNPAAVDGYASLDGISFVAGQ